MNKLNIINELISICGNQSVIEEYSELHLFNKDWDDKYNNKSICAVLPKNEIEISGILKFCNLHDIKVVPQGGNTGLVAGANPNYDDKEIILNLSKMNKIIEIDTTNYSINLEAGVILQSAQEEVSKYKLFLPIEMASSGSTQIGGSISTNAGGLNVIKYGSIREQILGMRVILANGEILELNSKMRKNNMGYDLKHLFCGSEGTLGIIISAVLKLYPLPESSCSYLMAYSSISQLLNSYKLIKHSFDSHIECCEYFTNKSFDLSIKNELISNHFFSKNYEYYLLLRLVDNRKSETISNSFNIFLEENQQNYEDILIPQDLMKEKQLWSFREKITEAQKREGYVIHNDISIPINEMENFFLRVIEVINAIDENLIIFPFGHLGDSNIHLNIICDHNFEYKDMKKLEFMVTDEINKLVSDIGGSISAEHGIGRIKKSEFLKYSNKINVEFMKKIKKIFDPKNILNPGKVFDI